MKWFSKYWKGIALGGGLIALSVAISFLPVGEWLTQFSDWIRRLGFVGVFIFIGVYALASVLLLPAALFTLAAGLIYGIAGGTAVALAGATLGAALAFLAGRYLFRDRIKQLAAKNEKFGAIDRAIGAQGWKVVGLLRMSPVIPFNVSNYLYGVTGIGFWPYMLASLVGMLPGTLLFAYLGAIGQAGLSGGEKGRSPLEWTFLGLGLLGTIAVTMFVSRLARNALKNCGASGK